MRVVRPLNINIGVGNVEERPKNPVKQLAVHFAHQMDSENRMYEENLAPWQVEEIKASGSELRNELWKKGYDVDLVLHYAEEYKTLSMLEYRNWIYE